MTTHEARLAEIIAELKAARPMVQDNILAWRAAKLLAAEYNAAEDSDTDAAFSA